MSTTVGGADVNGLGHPEVGGGIQVSNSSQVGKARSVCDAARLASTSAAIRNAPLDYNASWAFTDVNRRASCGRMRSSSQTVRKKSSEPPLGNLHSARSGIHQ